MITSKLAIGVYLHCKQCLDELPQDVAPVDWSKLSVGWTKQGLQVWCERHQCNVLHVDFEGHTHPANLRALNS